MVATGTANQTALLEAMTSLERRISDQLTTSVSQLSAEIRTMKDTHASALIEQERRNGEFASRLSVHEANQAIQAVLLENAIRSQRILAVENSIGANQERIDSLERNLLRRSADSLTRTHGVLLALIAIAGSVAVAVLAHFL